MKITLKLVCVRLQHRVSFDSMAINLYYYHLTTLLLDYLTVATDTISLEVPVNFIPLTLRRPVGKITLYLFLYLCYIYYVKLQLPFRMTTFLVLGAMQDNLRLQSSWLEM